MSNPEFEIECVMWNNERSRDNKWEIVDDDKGSYQMVPDLANIKVEKHEVRINDKEAVRVVNGRKQNLDYKKTLKTRENRQRTGRTIRRVADQRSEENVI